MNRNYGYNVWTYGIRTWHQTKDGAIARARTQTWCQDVQVIEVATGKQVSW